MNEKLTFNKNAQDALEEFKNNPLDTLVEKNEQQNIAKIRQYKKPENLNDLKWLENLVDHNVVSRRDYNNVEKLANRVSSGINFVTYRKEIFLNESWDRTDGFVFSAFLSLGLGIGLRIYADYKGASGLVQLGGLLAPLFLVNTTNQISKRRLYPTINQICSTSPGSWINSRKIEPNLNKLDQRLETVEKKINSSDFREDNINIYEGVMGLIDYKIIVADTKQRLPEIKTLAKRRYI